MQLGTCALAFLLFVTPLAQAQNSTFIPFDNKITATVQKRGIPFSIPPGQDVPHFGVVFNPSSSSKAGSGSKLDCVRAMGAAMDQSDYLNGQLAVTFGPVFDVSAKWLGGETVPLSEQGWRCLQLYQSKNTSPIVVRQGTYSEILVRTQYPASTFGHFEAMLQSLLYFTGSNPNSDALYQRLFGDRAILGIYPLGTADPCIKAGENWVCTFIYHVRDFDPSVDKQP